MIDSKDKLERFVCQNWNSINKFLDELTQKLPVPIYSSVDIRESQFKYAPVDTNLYPAGFNNLCLLDLNESSQAFRSYFKNNFPQANSIGLLIEGNTKNTYYLDHVAHLSRALRDAGYENSIISFDNSLFPESNTLDLISYSKFDVKVLKAQINEGEISTSQGRIDVVLLNNDQSEPIKIEWEELKTPIVPPPKMGWYKRSKADHFRYYHQVIVDFCTEFEIEPDLLEAKFLDVHGVDFATKEGLTTLADKTDELLKLLPQGKKVFLKADKGTYGMGISVVSSGSEIIEMNRKSRNKMDIGKNKIKFQSVLLQEGVDTILKYDEMPAEISIYLVGGKPVGGFMRANSLRDETSNLNAKGMIFRKFCISEIRQNQDHQMKEAIYSVIARLATIASAHEIKNIK